MGLAGKMALIAVQLAGLLLSALLVSVTYTNPMQVEERLQEFAIAEVERAADAAWSGATGQLGDGGRAERLGALSRQLGLDANAINLRRQQVVPALLSNVLSDSCRENCEFWVSASAITNSAMIERVAQLRVGQVTLQEFVLERYEMSVRGLLIDLRRFGLVNVVALSLMISLVVFRDHLNWRFTTLSAAVTGYTAWATYGYVFDQNWALSILLQDWAAPGYQVGMIFASCLFFDWLFLRGKVTQTVANIIGSILPS